METRTYTTYAEAVEREIVEPINAGDANADDYNIDTIADAVLGGHEDGYALKVNADEFWAAVEANELSDEDKKSAHPSDFVELFETGVQPEDAAAVLGMYLETGAKLKFFWKIQPNYSLDTYTYVVTLLVSMFDDFEDFQPLGVVFGNTDIEDQSGFNDRENGDCTDGAYPYEQCENELLERFGLIRNQLDDIDVCW